MSLRALFSTVAGFIVQYRERSISAWGETVQAQQWQWSRNSKLTLASSPGAHKFASYCQPHVSKKANRLAQTGHKDGRDFLHAIHSGHILLSLTPTLFITLKSFTGLSLRLFSSLNLTKIYLHTTLPLYSSIVSEFHHSSDVSCCVPTEHNPTLVLLWGDEPSVVEVVFQTWYRQSKKTIYVY